MGNVYPLYEYTEATVFIPTIAIVMVPAHLASQNSMHLIAHNSEARTVKSGIGRPCFSLEAPEDPSLPLSASVPPGVPDLWLASIQSVCTSPSLLCVSSSSVS